MSIPADFWASLASLGICAKDHALEQLRQRAAELGKSEEVRRFIEGAHGAASAAAAFSANVLANCRVGAHELSEEVGRVLAGVLDHLHADFPSPKAVPGHAVRGERVADALRRAGAAITQVLVGRGVPEATVKEYLGKLLPHVEHIVVLAGDLAEQHPVLLEVLIIAGVVLLASIPESWLLSRLLSMFGFGSMGALASWAQAFFLGAAVAQGSWLAFLQSAAMRQIAAGGWKAVAGGLAAMGWFGNGRK